MEPLFGVYELPSQLLEAYAHLWQFETWMRRLVYVQLRALDGDAWESKIETERALKLFKVNDKSMTHMPTPEDDVLSFILLSKLTDVVSEHWCFFESYLLPQPIWQAKLKEILTIRNRVAHFRSLHRDDLPRIVQFLRDIDSGFWRFCTSYNNPNPVFPPGRDPVTEHFLPLDHIPWQQGDDSVWAPCGVGNYRKRLIVTVEVLSMPWAEKSLPISGQKGFLYDVTIFVRGQEHLNYRRLLQSTIALHYHIVYICLGASEDSFRFTVPACLGTSKITTIVEGFYNAARNSLISDRSTISVEAIQAFADMQSEYVLGPQNPMTFLTPDCPCEFFQGISR